MVNSFGIMQFCFIQVIDGTMIESGLSLSLFFICFILFVDFMFVASHPIP